MSSLATISALIILSCLPVARADLNCDISIGDTNICSWANYHGGVIIAVVGAIVALVAFLGLSLYTSLFRRPNTSPALMNYAPRDEPQVPIQQYQARAGKPRVRRRPTRSGRMLICRGMPTRRILIRLGIRLLM
ncbi:hypothetical protein OG21DRAFT_583194 [Imleria badia]|nr:hypothetical protein OG21DRAFT_583194 [Imleria badia]